MLGRAAFIHPRRVIGSSLKVSARDKEETEKVLHGILLITVFLLKVICLLLSSLLQKESFTLIELI